MMAFEISLIFLLLLPILSNIYLAELRTYILSKILIFGFFFLICGMKFGSILSICVRENVFGKI